MGGRLEEQLLWNVPNFDIENLSDIILLRFKCGDYNTMSFTFYWIWTTSFFNCSCAVLLAYHMQAGFPLKLHCTSNHENILNKKKKFNKKTNTIFKNQNQGVEFKKISFF